MGQVAHQVDEQLIIGSTSNGEDCFSQPGLLIAQPESSIVMSVDGGYVRDWEQKKTCFEVIVGKSVPTDQPAKCFGFVQGYDQMAKQRITEF